MESGNKNNSWVGIVIVLFVLVGGYWYINMNQNTTQVAPSASVNNLTSSTPPTGNLVADKNLISIEKNTFAPLSLSIKAGETVTWVNKETYGHDVVSDDQTFKSVKLATGDKYSYTFTKAGTYTYFCSIHPFMKATIVVTQ